MTDSAGGGVRLLPVGANPKALEFPHFPDRLHAFVWRNWQLVESEVLAGVVGTTVENIVSIASSMGLPREGRVSPRFRERGYITIVRRNWHLLPYEQLLVLLGKSAEEFAFSLREDDGLYLKLGNLKPDCPPLRYSEPSQAVRERAAAIGRLVSERFGDQLSRDAEPRFHFVEHLSRSDSGCPPRSTQTETPKGLRLIYSYFGGYGDPLGDPDTDPYPDGLLEKLAECGVNGVWLHVVLRQMAPGGAHFPEFGECHETRLEGLRQLCERAGRFGIGVYLYINEPRAMPPAFFKERREMAGVREGDFVAMCTSDRRVREWLSDSLTHIFRSVPDLAGVFTITASENLTNCAVRFHHDECPRCRKRTSAEIVAEVNAAIEAGVHRGSPSARVIVWDWGWNHHGDAFEEISRLPERIELMSVSEWAMPIERGGVVGKTGEYSLSVVGPGPRASEHWKLAKRRGFKTVAKVQLNNSWELSIVPCLPVLDLVAEHFTRLSLADVDGMMLSWTLGGYPSPNLQVALRFAAQANADKDSVLNSLAADRYGPAAVAHIRKAWSAFSEALQAFPFDLDVLYYGPQHMGPANLLFAQPTGYRATMVGIPYDDLDAWRGPYPAEVLADQFERLSDTWVTGLSQFSQALAAVPTDKKAIAEADFGIARAAFLHFASTANQIRYVLLRKALQHAPPRSHERLQLGSKMEQLLVEEMGMAAELFLLASKDSRIGFEASNHYFYVPLDLVEKVINCEHLWRTLTEQT